MADKILVTARSFRKTEGPHLQMIRDAGYDMLNSPLDRPLEPAELIDVVGEAVGIILGVDNFTADVYDHAPRLKVISRYGVGVDKVDIAAATAHGVAVTTTPGANSVAVAELAIALMFALARHIPYHDRMVKGGGWARVTGIELTGLTLGLIGLGRIGQEVAKRVAGFGMRVLYYDPVTLPESLTAGLGVEYRPLESLLAESDVISLHLPFTPTTANMINRETLACLKPSALLINTSRGGLVDEQALYEALDAGRLGGAACDVFEKEPPGDIPLIQHDRFIAVPHIGSTTQQTTLRMGRMASENLLAVLRGERPASLANPEVFDRA